MEIDLFDPIDDSDQTNFFVTQPAIMIQGFSKAATRRLLSSPIPMRENISNSGAKKLIKEFQKYLKSNSKSELLLTVHDLDLKYVKSKDTFYFYLQSKENKIVGFLSIENYCIELVWIDPSYRGQNLGVSLYLAAINKLKKITSSTNIGIMAVRTWNKLAKYCKVSLYNEKNEKVKYHLDDRGVPVVNDIPIDKQKEDFYFIGTR